MDNVKNTIAKNITNLRLANNMTQVELGERLNYSDKAVSKWERGESVPDITVLAKIAKTFNVSLDFLVFGKEKNYDKKENPTPPNASKHNRMIITALSIILIWLITVLSFVINFEMGVSEGVLLTFICAIPASLIVWLVFNSIWFNRRRNFLIVSILMWSVIGAVYFSFLTFSINIPLIFLLGIPGQIAIFLCSKFVL